MMDWQWTTASIVLLSTSVLSLAIAIVLFRRRAIPGVPALASVVLAVAGWSLVAGLEAAAVPLAAKILFSKLEYVGSGSAAVLFLIFACRYTRRTSWMSRPRVAALWLLPLASVSLAATNEYHHLIWTAFSAGPAGSNAVIYHHGLGFFAIISGIYVYLLLASFPLISAAVRSSAVQQRQSATILLATAFPWASGILYAAGITLAPGLNLTPVSFVVTVAVLAVGVVPLRLFDLVPVARELLIEGMSDGILVIDADRRIVDVNPAARRMFALSSRIIGSDAQRVLSVWPQIAGALHADRETHFELTLSQDPLLHADLRVAPLRKRAHAAAGFLIVVRDISKRYLAETSLQNANERLQAQVREIEHLQGELREQAIRDALTGLFNRRHLDDMLPRILDRAAKDGIPVSVVMFDIDHFKQVNDTDGHRAGDALLAKLGELLLTRTRPGDIACRYGGEEFVLVLRETSLHTATDRAEEIKDAFRAVGVARLGHDRPPTLSAGIAVFPQHATSRDGLLHAADEALYRAKESGRDAIRNADRGSG